ncbi:MAG: NAD(+) synthase [Verrucomicrobia subdivision 3 bacterium]|nr:NAD(+) synthase [Verrucomicrobiota bacterium]MCC6821358.1 NAD(+) synthase [Limisphaerales bacterium]
MHRQRSGLVNFSRQSLLIDPAAESDRIIRFIRQNVRQTMRRGGGVVGISGGIDSAVVLALTIRAFGPRNVIAVMMPDRDSDPLSETYGRELASVLGVTPILEDITAPLLGFDCYQRRDVAIARVVPEYNPARGYKAKIVLPADLLENGSLNVFSVTVLCPDGRVETRPLPPREMLEIVAATNLKQRARMTTLYFHAEARQFAVIGTANKNEHAQGFFVKYGDGGVDIQPIAHLYKSQVYQLARHLEIPESIQRRTPTTDTYSAPCDQQEFFFRLPFETLDLIWLALETGLPAADVADVMAMTATQVQRVYDDIQRKQRTTHFLRMLPPVPEATRS